MVMRWYNKYKHFSSKGVGIQFLETAVRISNQLALGINMQCLGRIRIGGLVKIKSHEDK